MMNIELYQGETTARSIAECSAQQKESLPDELKPYYQGTGWRGAVMFTDDLPKELAEKYRGDFSELHFASIGDA